MSTSFILEYLGAPVRFCGRDIELVPEDRADQFAAEQAAWQAAYHAALSPDLCRVVNLYERRLCASHNN